jgi:uncharacterized protein with PIN domain
LTRRISAASQFDELIDRARIQIIPVDLEQGRPARDASIRFGKGRHPAGLNFGDCFHMHWPFNSANLCFLKVTISQKRM